MKSQDLINITSHATIKTAELVKKYKIQKVKDMTEECAEQILKNQTIILASLSLILTNQSELFKQITELKKSKSKIVKV